MGSHSNKNWKTRSDVIADIQNNLSGNFKQLAMQDSKSGVWRVVENKETKKRQIFLDLITRENSQFWVKGLAESEFPYYFDVPLEFLDQVSPENGTGLNMEWRNIVKERK